MGDDGPSPLPSKPGHHHLRRLAGVPTTLISSHDNPRNLSGQITRLLGHGGLHRADRVSVLASAHDPVKPPLRPVRGAAHDLASVPLLQLDQAGRLPAHEDMQLQVVQQRRHLLRVFNLQRLKLHPPTLQNPRIRPLAQVHMQQGRRWPDGPTPPIRSRFKNVTGGDRKSPPLHRTWSAGVAVLRFASDASAPDRMGAQGAAPRRWRPALPGC